MKYSTKNTKITNVAVCVLAFIGIASVIVMIITPLAIWHEKILAKSLLALCGVLPPLWFWIEYEFIWCKAEIDHRPTFEDIKYGQELSRNLWLAFFGILIALYFK